MIAWMLYCVIIGLCVVVAAWSAEGLARMRRWPTRLVWIGAAVLLLILAVTAPSRSQRPRVKGQSVDLSSITFVQTSIESVGQRVPGAAVAYIAGVWGLASLLATWSFLAAHARLRKARRAWPVVELQGQRVRLSPATGPIVIGVVRPEIIIPRWVLRRSPEEQRVILAHEGAHVHAGDHILLAFACAFVVLAPWHPGFWIILSRVRLAIEIDCDARVLGSGLSPRSYCSLLIDVAESATPVLLGATALADDASHLHQRILAMQPRRFAHPKLRAASVAAAGLTALLAACEAKMPTAADIAHADAASVESSARGLGLLADTSVVWMIDGRVASEAAAKQIARDRIASVEVVKGGLDGRSRIYLTTISDRQTASTAPREMSDVAQNMTEPRRDTAVLTRTMEVARAHALEPILLIDGVRSDMTALRALDRERIDKIEVLKGALAVETYGADAKNGVIVVSTKPAAR